MSLRLITSSLLALLCFSGMALHAADEPIHWSLRPLTRPKVPEVAAQDRAQTPIDQFILAALERNDMTLSPPAEKRILLRRIYFDLIGLPPTPDEIAAFEADTRPAAVRSVVDRLLDSPQYGERWARHWLDVVHYAETHGHDQDRPRTNAWPYRDYVIASFNQDKPYARFVEEQIAGDVLFPDDPQATVALGFLATGPWDESSLRDIQENTTDRQVARYIDRDDIVATTMNTFMSTTAQCARCHNHKFDPISASEYYSLQAVFAGTEKGNRLYDSDPKIHRQRQELLARRRSVENKSPAILKEMGSPEFARRFTAWENSLASKPDKELPDLLACYLTLDPANRDESSRSALARYFLNREISDQLATLPSPQLVFAGASDFVPDGNHKPVGKPRPVHILRRGELRLAGDEALPGALSCVPGMDARLAVSDPENEGLRRAALARWISDPRNVLTWRSIVNRVWHHHFGRGIVSTPNDFGKMGDTPSHPELLDWLTNWFLEKGGSFKELHRLILTSAAYQQSSRVHPAFAERDANNRLLWRMNSARLDAESVRDAILAITGKIELTMGGPSVQQFVMSPGIHVTPVVDYLKFDIDSEASYRRSIYRFIFRTLSDPFMDSLDCPDSSQLTPTRNNSVTVLQALALLNNRFVVRQAEHFAARLAKTHPDDLPAQVNFACQLAFGRPVSPGEKNDLLAYAQTHGTANLCRVLFNSNEFMFVN